MCILACRRPPAATAAPPPCRLLLLQATASSNSYHVLQYKYVGDILEKRGPFREQHLAGAHKMASAPRVDAVDARRNERNLYA